MIFPGLNIFKPVIVISSGVVAADPFDLIPFLICAMENISLPGICADSMKTEQQAVRRQISFFMSVSLYNEYEG